MPQTPLQELESTILQRRHYLATQDNQIQRNQQLLLDQQKQLKLNKAKISKQAANLDSLTKDAQTALESLRKQAETAPTQRYLNLTSQCAKLERELMSLKRQKKAVEVALTEAGDHLDQLDMEIIEADAINKDLEQQIKEARKRLQAANRRAGFQAKVVTDLEYDLKQAEQKLEQTHNLKLALEKDQDSIISDITAKQRLAESLTIDIAASTEKLQTLNLNIAAVSKSLQSLLKKDKDFRGRLAQEKQQLEREKEDLKISKESLKQDIAVRKQLNPQWKPRNSGEPAHFKL